MHSFGPLWAGLISKQARLQAEAAYRVALFWTSESAQTDAGRWHEGARGDEWERHAWDALRCAGMREGRAGRAAVRGRSGAGGSDWQRASDRQRLPEFLIAAQR